jgi:enoyl-CoA hydratase/carnithine racemase
MPSQVSLLLDVGGLQIALGADLRYCAPDAQFSVMGMRWSRACHGNKLIAARSRSRRYCPELICTVRKISAEEPLPLVGL